MGFQSNRRREQKTKTNSARGRKTNKGRGKFNFEKHAYTFGSFSCTAFVTVLKIFKLSATETWSKLMSPEISCANHKLKIETVPNIISTKPITHISKAVFNYL